MKIKILTDLKSKNGLLVAPLFKEDISIPPKFYPEPVRNFIKTLKKTGDIKGARGKTYATYIGKADVPKKALVICLGEKNKMTCARARVIGAKIGKHAAAVKEKEVNVFLPVQLVAFSQEFIEGMLMSQYDIGKFKTAKSKNSKKHSLEEINIIVARPEKSLKAAFEKAEIINEGANYVKDLINGPSNMVDSDYLSKEAKDLSRKNKYGLKIFGTRELKKEGWGALLAVNMGSGKDAKCIVLQYLGAKKRNEKPIVIVGKGIVFDSGGYNLKPANFIETMHQDKAGGCVVLGLFKILKKLAIRKNVIGIIPIAENMISAKAYRPSDVITSLSGKTIEITNTDAEGRLILADAITYGTKFKPQYLITIATLTGAVIIALGDRFSGLMANDRVLRNNLQKAGRETDDLGWPLPMHRDYNQKIDSEIADIRNLDTSSGRKAGASKGAAFLERFVEKNKWCHIDIGGTAFTDDPKEYESKGATSHGLQMLLRFLENEV
ncbi:MAG: leucyl aminopeptidase [Candidatus Peregrinibacteria bacterium]